MERLTFEGNFCDIAMCNEVRGGSFCENGDCSQRKIWERLKVIEDILGDEYDLNRLRELTQADREGRCVVLDMPRKPLVWGDDDQNTCLCPYCDKDLMGIPYGERMVLQCPECGQYLDATKVGNHPRGRRGRTEEAALRREQDG